MHATDSRERSILFASATRSTGSRKRFAEAGEMLRLTTGRVRSGCDTVTVAVRVSAAGGMMTVKLPTDTVPPSRPTVTVLVVAELAPPPRRSRPRISAGASPVAVALNSPSIAVGGCVGRSEHPATASRTARPRAKLFGNRVRPGFMVVSFGCAAPGLPALGPGVPGAALRAGGVRHRPCPGGSGGALLLAR